MVRPIVCAPSGVAQAIVRHWPRVSATMSKTQTSRPPVIQSSSPRPRSPDSPRAPPRDESKINVQRPDCRPIGKDGSREPKFTRIASSFKVRARHHPRTKRIVSPETGSATAYLFPKGCVRDLTPFFELEAAVL